MRLMCWSAKQLEQEYVKTHELVHNRLERMAETAKARYDKDAQRQPLRVGEEVPLRNEMRRSKLDPFWVRGWIAVRSKGLLVTIRRKEGP